MIESYIHQKIIDLITNFATETEITLHVETELSDNAISTKDVPKAIVENPSIEYTIDSAETTEGEVEIRVSLMDKQKGTHKEKSNISTSPETRLNTLAYNIDQYFPYNLNMPELCVFGYGIDREEFQVTTSGLLVLPLKIRLTVTYDNNTTF